MIWRMLATVLVLALCVGGTAVAQTCTNYPYTLTNGTTADANQVMANFNYVLNCASNQAAASILRGWLGGLTLSNNATNPNTVINTAAGVANADDATTLMTLAPFTKNANAAWAVGTGKGCLTSGSSLVANTWYHLFVIARTDTGVVDEMCSTSATAPTMPTSYTKKRRIGSFKTNASAQILAFSQLGDEFVWKTSAPDVNAVAISTTALTPTLTVPTGVQVNEIFRATVTNAGNVGLLFTSPDENDQAAGLPHNDLTTPTTYTSGRFNVRTNTSAQIRARSATSGSTYWVDTYGWIDTRGRFN